MCSNVPANHTISENVIGIAMILLDKMFANFYTRNISNFSKGKIMY